MGEGGTRKRDLPWVLCKLLAITGNALKKRVVYYHTKVLKEYAVLKRLLPICSAAGLQTAGSPKFNRQNQTKRTHINDHNNGMFIKVDFRDP